ncbi:zinc finger CCCH domain-containing protein 19-like isoform X2 [Impatiens glandulifera]|uniref:zinc finger CCCH domain-containing protein 19-like isoform X2 n=1 Tax=Impatiens glandulifera TaxID=253017 RepID=UPI001FB19C66|nr:zinc finger CCCH domain-containing protein 19-like isoform X2 [Impatiens glandulifera]
MEDEDEKVIFTMDNEVHDTKDKPLDATEILKSEERSDMGSSILPHLCDSQLIVGSSPPPPPPSLAVEEEGKVEDEVTQLVGMDMFMETAADVVDRQGEDDVECSLPSWSEQDDVEFFGDHSSVHIPGDMMIGNDISLDFDDSELKISNTWSIIQDEEIKIHINEEGDGYVEAVVTCDIPTKMDYDIENCVKTQSVEDGVGNCLPRSDILQSFDTLGEEYEAIEKEQVEVMDEEHNVDVESSVISKLGQKDEAIGMEGTVGDPAPEPDNVEVSLQSIVAAELCEEDEVMGEENVGVTEMEENHIQLLDGVEDVVGCTPTKDDDGEESMEEDDPPTAETEMEIETDVIDVPELDNVTIAAGKRKRGKNAKVSTRASTRTTIGEDVCFICFDGGELVLCDRRGCPKVYHPSCVNRDEAFFRAKGRWNCGWHLCSICEKNGHYSCYTCTFSVCKVCTKDAVILCVRGNKGFCETCMKTVMLIENNEASDNKDKVDFDDKSSWEFLFKDYWTDLKEKLSITTDELALAKNPRRGPDVSIGKEEANEENIDVNNGHSGSDSSEHLEDRKSKRRLSKRKSKRREKTEEIGLPNTSEIAFVSRGWASQELLEFVMHMKDGDNSVLSQFDVQALLLEYIKTNKLRDPRRKSQIICDARLENLFGKARVGHFEMLKLLESHFLIKDDTHIDDVQGTVVDTDVNQVERDENNDSPIKGGSKEKKRRIRKKGYDRGLQSNLNDYAAIDNHNINLIYLRRKLVEDVLEDVDKFHDTVVGTFVRIRIPGNNQKQDLYRLVQVIGTTKAPKPYKVGKRTTSFFLEVLNLDKTEVVGIDTISNQEFTEDECKRLRQSIKCGLINRLTVGDILHKATIMHVARVNDCLEAETQRLFHLRDRASEKGRKKELRECVEKLQFLRTPEERRRRLDEIPEIRTDPKMDPNYESEDDDSDKATTAQENYLRPGAGSGFSRNNGRETISPGRGNLTNSGSGSKKSSYNNLEFSRSNSGKDFSNKIDDKSSVSKHLDESSSRNQVQDGGLHLGKMKPETKSETVVKSESFTSSASNPPKIIETEKSWLYKDPSGKTQGLFSVVQLRKWSNNGYFPTDLKVWRNKEGEETSILLTDALAGKFHQQSQSVEIPLSSPPNPVKLETRENDKGMKSSPIVQVVSKFSTQDGNINPAALQQTPQQPPPVGIKSQDVNMNPAAPQIRSKDGNMNSAAPQRQPPVGIKSEDGNMNSAALQRQPPVGIKSQDGNMNPAAPQRHPLVGIKSQDGIMNPAAPQRQPPVGIKSQDGNMNPATPQRQPPVGIKSQDGNMNPAAPQRPPPVGIKSQDGNMNPAAPQRPPPVAINSRDVNKNPAIPQQQPQVGINSRDGNMNPAAPQQPPPVGINNRDGNMNTASPHQPPPVGINSRDGSMNPIAPQQPPPVGINSWDGTMIPSAPQPPQRVGISRWDSTMNPAAPQPPQPVGINSQDGNMNPAAPLQPPPVGINSQDGNMNPAAPQQPLPLTATVSGGQLSHSSTINPEISTILNPHLNGESTQPEIPSHHMPQGQPYVQIPGPNYSNPGLPLNNQQPSPWAVQNNPFPPGPRPDGSNMTWGPMPGWVGPGPVQATGNMNWNPGWVGPPPMAGFMQPGMMNPGWFPQMCNPSGWYPPPPPPNTNQPQMWCPQQPGGNMGPPPPVQSQGGLGPQLGNANLPGWSGPPSNSGTWGNDHQNNNGNKFSGRGSGSGYNGGRAGRGYDSKKTNNSSRICMFHRGGHCKKGSTCRHAHK